MPSTQAEPSEHIHEEIEATEMDRYQESPNGTYGPRAPDSASSKLYCSMKRSIPRPIKSFWNNQISITVPHDSCRDHFALERTFLGYLRTSMALTMVGVFIAQLFRLQHTPNPNKVFGYFVLAIPLAVICIGVSMLVLAFGAYRFWRQQNAMLRGKVYAGGWEVNATATAIISVTVLIFVLLIAVDVHKNQ